MSCSSPTENVERTTRETSQIYNFRKNKKTKNNSKNIIVIDSRNFSPFLLGPIGAFVKTLHIWSRSEQWHYSTFKKYLWFDIFVENLTWLFSIFWQRVSDSNKKDESRTQPIEIYIHLEDANLLNIVITSC